MYLPVPGFELQELQHTVSFTGIYRAKAICVSFTFE